MTTRLAIASLRFVIAAALALASVSESAPIRMILPADPLHPGADELARNAVLHPELPSTGAILRIEPPNVPCGATITFADLPAASPPGTSYDAIFESGNSDFGERFAGQSLSAGGGFDVLSGDPSGPLGLVAGDAGRNQDVMNYLGNHILSPLGPAGFPLFGAVGEGAFAVLFDHDQSLIAFDVVGGDGGNASVEFFRRDGTRIDAHTLTSLSDRRYAFRRADGTRDIAGFSVWNEDLAGIGIDNICHDVPGFPGHAPECAAAVASPAVLWPPNHRFVPVRIAGITDPDGDALAITFTGVTQNEPLDGGGDGHTCPDAEIDAGGGLLLRAERSGSGPGRTYTVRFTATDPNGGSCSGSVQVCVPREPNSTCTGAQGAIDALAWCDPGPRRGTLGSETRPIVVDDVSGTPGSGEQVGYALSEGGEVDFAIHDLSGRRVATIDRGSRDAGRHEVWWDASGLRTGVYFYRLTVGGKSAVRKRLIVR